jgi:hypothetical protein
MNQEAEGIGPGTYDSFWNVYIYGIVLNRELDDSPRPTTYSPKLFPVIVYILKLVNDSLSFFSSLIFVKEKFRSRLAPIIIEVWWLASMAREFTPAFLVLAKRSQILFNFCQLCPTG